MTNASSAASQFVTGPSRKSRTGSTLRLHLLMEARQRLEIGERITALRERSPWTQPAMAEKLGIGLRGYQKLEKEGTTRYERCEEIADIHKEWAELDPDWSFVSAGWLWDGRERQRDLMEALNGGQTETPDLRRVEEAVEALRAETAESLDRLHAELRAIQRLLEPSGRKQKAARS